MNDAGFLQAIRADPDDDAIRLIYADWLDEHAGQKRNSQDRAEFIRGQVELARVTKDSPSRRKLAFRIRELLERHGEKWLGPLKKHVHGWHFHRGFLDKVGVSADTLEEQAKKLFTSAPLRQLWVTGLDGDLAPLLRIPQQHSLTSLDLCYNQLSSAALEQLTTFASLGGLHTLGLMFNLIDDEGARLLREHPFFQKLALIRCGANPIREPARQELQQYFGDRISFVCERDDDHLYAIRDDRGFIAGFGKETTQLLFRGWELGVRVAIFDHEGNLLDIQSRDVSPEEGSGWQQQAARRDVVKEVWMKEFSFESATIRVKRFCFEDGEGIYGFNWWQEAFNDPNHEQGYVREGVGAWLSDGQFEWNFIVDNCWLDGTGEVTDT